MRQFYVQSLCMCSQLTIICYYVLKGEMGSKGERGFLGATGHPGLQGPTGGTGMRGKPGPR